MLFWPRYRMIWEAASLNGTWSKECLAPGRATVQAVLPLISYDPARRTVLEISMVENIQRALDGQYHWKNHKWSPGFLD